MTPSRPSIDRIKAAVDLPSMVQEYLPLRPMGKEWIGLCPFHKERSPSLRVHSEYWKCFGCGAGGDVVTFLSLIDGITPGAALRTLSERTGIPLDGKPQTRVARAYDAQQAEFTEWWWKRLCERLARRLSMYVAWGSEGDYIPTGIGTTSSVACVSPAEADAAGLMWRQVAALDRQGCRALCERMATSEEREEWRDVKWFADGGWATVDITPEIVASLSPEIQELHWHVKSIVSMGHDEYRRQFDAGTLMPYPERLMVAQDKISRKDGSR